MPNIYELQKATESAAQTAFTHRLINKDTFHRLTDGTVSKYDVTEAHKLVEERRSLYEAKKQDNPNDPTKWKALEKSYYEAVRLEGCIKRQYDEQGYLETGAENTKDWWNGSGW